MKRSEELLKQNLQLMENWPTVLDGNLKPDYVVLFQKRRKAMEAYVETDKSLVDICKEYDLHKSDFYRLLNRCLILHPDGRPFGYRA